MMLSRLLFKWSGQLPFRRIDSAGKAYLERYYLGHFWRFTFYLHRFVGADDERVVHDHPWSWAVALVLCGGYREERMKHMDPEQGWICHYRTMFPGRLNFIRAHHFHRIRAPKKETWTLFCHSKKIKNWGFLQTVQPQGVLYKSHEQCGRSTQSWETVPLGKDAVGRTPIHTRMAGSAMTAHSSE